MDNETKAFTVRLPEDQASALEKIAQVDDMPLAEAVRTAIQAHIETRRKDQDFQNRLREIIEQDRKILEQLAD